MEQNKNYRADKDLGVFLYDCDTNKNPSKLQALNKCFSSQKF